MNTDIDGILKNEFPAMEKIYPLLMKLTPYTRVKVMQSLWTLTGCADLSPMVEEEEAFRRREIRAALDDKRRQERAKIRAEIASKQTNAKGKAVLEGEA